MTTPLSDERIDELAYRLKGTVTNPIDWWCEATDLFKVGCELLAEVTRLRSRVARLEGVMREVEWTVDVQTERMFSFCPWCHSYDKDHAPDCELDAALRDADE